MTQERKLTLKGRCWRFLTAWLPPSTEKRLKAGFKAVMRLFGWKEPNPILQDDLSRQLDAVLRELRRLHARLEEVQDAVDDLGRFAGPGAPLRRQNGGEAA